MSEEVIETKALSVVQAANEITVVTCAADMTVLAGRVRMLKDMIKDVDAHYKEITRPMDDAKAAVLAQKKRILAPLEAEEARLRRVADAYTAEQARTAQAEAARRQEALRAEAAALRAQAEAEREAAAVFGGDFEDPNAAEAIMLENEAFDLDRAARKTTVGNVMQEQGVKAAGTGVRTDWLFEVEDESLIPDKYWIVDLPCIKDEVKRKKGDCKIPGVRVYSESKTIIR